MKNFVSGLFLGVLIFSSKESYAQWRPDVRLTNNSALSNTSYGNAWCIAATGDVVHAVWYDNRDQFNNEIYYKRSTDGGISWGADTRMTNSAGSSYFPSISVSGQVVHVVWREDSDGNHEIYYKRSTDGGVSWEEDARLTNDPFSSWYPSVTVSASVVHVVWMDFRNSNIPEIYYKRSSDGGISWGNDARLTIDAAPSRYPSVSVSGQVVHVVWQDTRDGNRGEIYYKRSTDGGVIWGEDTRLTNNPEFSEYPSVSVSGQVVHVVWMDFRDSNYEIYYKRSADGGVSWGEDVWLTNNVRSVYPSISVSGQIVHVVWQDGRDGDMANEIYYKCSTDGGISWGEDVRLTNAPAISTYPSVSVSGQAVHVVWTDNRDGNEEIYYKRDPTGSPTDVIILDEDVPHEYILLQNYPNPFNPTTTIRFSIPVGTNGPAAPAGGHTSLRVHDVLGREVATIVNEKKSPGRYEVQWNAEGLSSGVYLYRLQVGDFVSSKKLTLLR